MGNFKGSNTTTSTTAPNPQAGALYSDILGKAQSVAATPYTPYGGQMVAGFTPDQLAAFNGVNATQGISQPYLNSATSYANAGASPITGADISRYQNPYQQNVLDTTLANINANNAQQRAALTGDAIGRGAFGGDRAGIAQNDLARQQDLATNSTIAGLESQGFNTSLGAAQADRAAAGQGAYTFGNLASEAQALPLQGAAAQLQTGNLQQQLAQANLNVPYQQYLEGRAYPFQTLSWEAGLGTGVGSQLGGTSTTTPPQPNPLNSILGAGLSLGSLFLKHGGRIIPAWHVPHKAGGGGFTMPYAGGFIPNVPITPGQGAPKAPGSGSADTGAGKMLGNALDFAGAMRKHFNQSDQPLDLGSGFSPDAIGTLEPMGSAPAVSMLGPMYAKGGRAPGGIYLPRFDDGGPVPFADRAAAVQDAIASGAFDPQGADYTAFAPPALGAPRRDDDRAPALAAIDRAAPIAPTAPTAPADFGDPDVMAFDRAGAPGAGIGVPVASGDAQPGSGGFLSRFGVNVSPDVRSGLLAAGLGMMASKSPFVGQAIGEGGLHGLEQYGAQQKAGLEKQKVANEQDYRSQTLAQGTRRIDLEAKHLADQANQAAKALAETSKQHSAQIEQQQAQLAEQHRQHDMGMKAPVKIGEERNGTPIMALPRLNDSGAIDYYRINRDGTISDAPIGAPSSPPSPTLSPGVAPGPTSALPSAPGNAAQPTRTAALNTGEIVTDAPPPEVRAAMPPASPGARDDQFLAKIAETDPGYAKLIKSIADYQTSPSQFSLRNNRRERAMGDLIQYDPTYDQRRFNQTNRAITGWAQSPEGRSTRSLSVTIEHLGTAEELGQALGNHDTQAINRLQNWAKTQLGYEGPVNFEFAKQIVADEIAKAVIGGQNGEADRRALQEQISRASSPEQLAGVARTAKQLMAGQVLGLQHTYETATGLHNFDSWLTPRAKAEIAQAAATHAAPAGGGAATASPQNAAALDWANRNPNDPRAAAIKKKLGVQ